MYTPDGSIEPIPGTIYGIMPVRLYDNDKDHRTQPTGYVLTLNVSPFHYIDIPGLHLTMFSALKEAVTMTEIDMRDNDPESQ